MSRADPPPRAVIDADIIYSRVLHDLMGRVADDLGLPDLVWSQELLAEAKQALIERKGKRDAHSDLTPMSSAISSHFQ